MMSSLNFRRKMLATQTFIQFISEIEDESGIETILSDDCTCDIDCMATTIEELLLLSEISKEIQETNRRKAA